VSDVAGRNNEPHHELFEASNKLATSGDAAASYLSGYRNFNGIGMGSGATTARRGIAQQSQRGGAPLTDKHGNLI